MVTEQHSIVIVVFIKIENGTCGAYHLIGLLRYDRDLSSIVIRSAVEDIATACTTTVL